MIFLPNRLLPGKKKGVKNDTDQKINRLHLVENTLLHQRSRKRRKQNYKRKIMTTPRINHIHPNSIKTLHLSVEITSPWWSFYTNDQTACKKVILMLVASFLYLTLMSLDCHFCLCLRNPSERTQSLRYLPDPFGVFDPGDTAE